MSTDKYRESVQARLLAAEGELKDFCGQLLHKNFMIAQHAICDNGVSMFKSAARRILLTEISEYLRDGHDVAEVHENLLLSMQALSSSITAHGSSATESLFVQCRLEAILKELQFIRTEHLKVSFYFR